jgi:hypothetical protein
VASVKAAILPPVFSRYSAQVSYVAQRGANEFSSTCPTCGGTSHADNAWPDRCRWFTDGKARGWCRQCGSIFWPDEAASQRVSTAEQETWRREREQTEQRRKAEAEKALENLRQEKSWLQYVEMMDASARAWWEKQGIPGEWQDHLQLGYTPRRAYWGPNEELRYSPAYTVPYFHTDFQFMTLQYRLSDATDPSQRYRFEHGLGTSYYQAEPGAPIGERVIICEGAKKAMVLHIRGGQDDLTVLAIPSKGGFAGVVEAVADRDRVYILLDPDAGAQARKLAGAIGPAARVVDLPVKIDDGIMQYGLTPARLADALRYARPV